MIAEHDAVGSVTEPNADDAKIASHEDAAHEKRNWVRLTYDCNNHCVFCLDFMAHNGTLRNTMDIKVQIIEGRKQGADRLILSGGEPTMHPNFLDFVKLGKRAGYPKVQTVTNGRMFAYDEFLQQAADNGLNEVTFSLHGHTAELHDRLVGVPGAFVEETAGLKAALASGRFIVNVDIVINKQNVKHLPDMLETFMGWGVREFDLLQVIPFGGAWSDAREHLFYDLEGNEEALRRAFAYSRRPDVHIWLNRFPPPFTEGFEELIQDPYKLNDEVRGRREEYDRYLSIGEPLQCRDRDGRCRYCYMEQLCNTLDDVLEERARPEVDVLRLEAPAPLSGQLPPAKAVHAVARDLTEAKALVDRAGAEEAWLDLADYSGLFELLADDGTIWGTPVARCYASDGDTARELLGRGDFDVAIRATGETEPVIRENAESSRIVVVQPTYSRLTEQKSSDVDIAVLCRDLPAGVRVEGVPPCLSGRAPAPERSQLDGGMLGADARVDMGRYAKRYISDRYFTKSRRCGSCKYDDRCSGVHINFVRAHGYAKLQPIER